MRQLLGGRGGGRRLVRDGWSESNGHQRDCARGRGKLERDTRVMQSRGEEERKLSLAAESNRCQLGEMREERGVDDERRAGKEGGRTLLIGKKGLMGRDKCILGTMDDRCREKEREGKSWTWTPFS